MKFDATSIRTAIAAAFVLLLSSCGGQEHSERTRIINSDWTFTRDSLSGAEAVAFDDSDWKKVDLPHDFSIEPLEEHEYHLGPFSRAATNARSTGYLPGGTGWYRKDFTLSDNDKGKSVTLVIEGAYMESDVYVNGTHVKAHKHGYTPFGIDITGLLNAPGVENTLAIKVVNYGKNTRWYAGSGLYRDVKLVVTDPVHVDLWGTYITASDITVASADVNVKTDVRNDLDEAAAVAVKVSIKDRNGNIVGTAESSATVAANACSTLSSDITVKNPQLWDIDNPVLYTAEVIVEKDGKTVDTYEDRFGIRTIEYSAEEGFKLNGKTTLLKGGCIHHDNTFLGAAAVRRAEYRKIELLKKSGFNAIRTAHNPPSEYLLDACDELGMLVMDEFTDMWEQPKNTHDYANFFKENWEADLTDFMRRDRNHPSVIMWSVGNEVPNWSIADASRITKMLSDKVRELDPTRPVTMGVTSAYIHLDWDNSAESFKHLDLAGYNYLRHYYRGDHDKHPERIIVSTESYANQAYEYWKDVEELPYVIGDFVWTAMDHLGEAGMGGARYVKEIREQRQFQTSNGPGEGFNPAMMWTFPDRLGPELPVTYTNWCGDIDLTGEKKNQGLYRDVLWDVSPIEVNVHEPIPDGMIESAGLWGWANELPKWYWPEAEGKNLGVRVFTKGDNVKLYLDGTLVGECTPDEKHIAEFNVTYQPGELKAVAYRNGAELGTKILRTPGEPAAIRLKADRTTVEADRHDLSYVRIEVVDKDGNVVPGKFPVKISIEGNGTIAGSGNAATNDMASFNSPELNTYEGGAIAIIRPYASKGSITFTAASETLGTQQIKIKVK